MRLRTLVESMAEPESEVVFEAAESDSTLSWLRANDADLLLLDIRMPGRGGLALAGALRSLARPPLVVFVTAHASHAVAAFDLDAVDYLTKPVRRERLEAALRRVHQRLHPPQAASAAPLLVVHDRGRVLRLPIDEVLYLKAELKYVTLRTAHHSYVLDDALAELESRLGPGFLRIHRNALVARHAVRALERRAGAAADEGWAVCVAPADEWLAVSRRQVAAVRAALADA
ncbi:MAG: response regulator transcription factor [Burkholderiales bacterium]|nr:response regulator transcription factor [Burkholderiales bacterium]MDE2393933.1 response regulator transcription factor [Burkholderiales bacterium]MDE2457481.1 response regulator transcription factor [Burkholderiales bacterium]